MPKYNPLEEEKENLKVCYFMKHQGQRWEDIIKEDRAYVAFLVDDYDLEDVLYDYLMNLLEDYYA